MPKKQNEGVNPEVMAPEIPQEIQRAHNAVMGYTRSGLWVRVGKILIASSLAAIILIYLISRIFAMGNMPAISPINPDGIGIKGEKGDKGDDGLDGQDGQDGADGEKGDKGADGKNGKDGQDGKDGANGQKGDKGDTGPQGPQGESGGMIQDNEKGNFVISLAQLNKGIAISEHKDYWNNTTPYLHATALKDCWNITYADIPSVVDSNVGGTKNGKNYFAYTFYLKNNSYSKVALDYNLKLRLTKDQTGAIGAIRFQLYEDGVSTIYGKSSSSGKVEPFACDKPFTGDVNLLDINVRNFAYNQVKRYTIVLWYEGNDPECVDNILPASIDMSMVFEVLD